MKGPSRRAGRFDELDLENLAEATCPAACPFTLDRITGDRLPEA